MDIVELRQQADRNLETFNKVLNPYVSLKIESAAHQLKRGARNAWLDASGCVWCLFDDPAFLRSGNEASTLKEELGDELGLQVYWSMGDVVMPPECSPSWVAQRILEEAMKQLSELRYHRKTLAREVDGERHEGVIFAKTLFRLW